MLRIHKSYNGQAASAYFEQALSKEGNYYLDKEIVAYWEGEAAQKLGLKGKQVEKGDFNNLMNNIDPQTQEQLTVRNVANRRVGFDFTFNAPKSISIIHAITKDAAILEAHRLAYQKAMKAIEASAQTQANSKDGRFYQNTANLIYSAFDHFTSRPVAIEHKGRTQYASDPLLHTHCYVPNVTWNENKKRFQALEVGNIHRLAPWFEAIYHSHLSHQLNKLGYSTRRTHERYEIVGVTRKTIEKYSNRSKHIEEVARKKGIIDPKAKSALGALTRNAKGKSVKEIELHQIWKDRLTSSEFQKITNIKRLNPVATKTISAKEAIDLSLSHHLERNSTAQEKRVLAHALALGYGHLLPQDVQKELDRRDNVLRSDKNTITHITTREMVMAEDRMIELAVSTKGEHPPLNSNYSPKQEFLNETQRKAIKEILNSNDGITILRGSAGTGKTSLLTEVRDGAEINGRSLFAVAPSTQATQVLKQKSFKANTISALLHNPQLQKQLNRNVLLVDEAGMIGVESTSKLLEIAREQRTRVILSGDTKQHGPPGQFGDALRILQDKAKLQTTTVQKIVRQKPEAYRTTIELLAKGEVIKGYNGLEKLGAIKEIPDSEKRLGTIADDYVGSIKNRRTAIAISPTHREGELLTDVIRGRLKAEGVIQGEEREFETLHNLSFTKAQKQDGASYQQGHVLRFIKNQKGGFKAGEHYEILPCPNASKIKMKSLKNGKTYDLPNSGTENYQVYQKTKTLLAKGDTIRLTNNGKTIENSKVTNGTSYQIKGFTKTGDLRLTNGKTLSRKTRHFRHGYVDTSYSSQGKDCQDVYISMSDMSFAGTNEQTLYVAASRGTHSISIYTSDKSEMKKAVLRSGERMTAKEIAYGQNPNMLLKYQQAHHQSLNQKLKEHARLRKTKKSPERGISGQRNYNYEP